MAAISAPMLPVSFLLAISLTQGAALPTGQVVASVRTTANPSQSYALYLPKGYTPTRAWPLILAFDLGGRGQTAVERYQAAAEQYGFVIAGSNNSRNYSRDNDAAVTSMASDVLTRFPSYRRAACVYGRDVRRRARCDGHRARVHRDRGRDGIERGISGRRAAGDGAIRDLRDRRHGGFQSP